MAQWKKSFCLIKTLFAIFTFASTATASPLAVGDLVVISQSLDTNTVRVLALADLQSGTTVHLTDQGLRYDGILVGAPWEGTITWTVGTPVEAGETFQFDISVGTPSTVTLLEVAANIDRSSEITVSGWNGLVFGETGDQLLIYQGSDTAPRFITGLHNSGNTSAHASPGEWQDSGSTNTAQNLSHLPPELTNQVNALAFSRHDDQEFLLFRTTHQDNLAYNGPTTAADKASWLARIFDRVNWTGDQVIEVVGSISSVPGNSGASVTVNDSSGGGGGGGGGNTPPVITHFSGDRFSYAPGSGEHLLDQEIPLTVTDSDSPNFGNGSVIAVFQNGSDSTEDQIGIRTGGAISLSGTTSGSTVAVGSTLIGVLRTDIIAGNSLRVDLTANATPAHVQALLREVTYENTDTNAPTPGVRTIRVTVDDGDGGTSQGQDISFLVTSQNNPPEITFLDGDTLTYTEGEEPQTLDQNEPVEVSDVDSPDFEGGELLISIDGGGNTGEDLLSLQEAQGVSLNGTTAGSEVLVNGTIVGLLGSEIAPGNDLSIGLNANATPSTVALLLQRCTYANTETTAPTLGPRTIQIQVNDGDGGGSAIQEVSVTVVGQNNSPEIFDLDGDSILYTEGDGKKRLDTDLPARLIDPDSPNFFGGYLSLSLLSGSNPREDLLTLDDVITVAGTAPGSNVIIGGSVVGTLRNPLLPGNNLTIDFQSGTSIAHVQSLIWALSYENVNVDDPTPGTRIFSLIVTDDQGASTSLQQMQATVQTTNDDPELSLLDGDALFYQGGDGAVLLDRGTPLLLSDIDSPDLANGIITVTFSAGRVSSEDQLHFADAITLSGEAAGSNVLVDGAVIGTLTSAISTGEPLAITLTSEATVARVQTLLRAVTYENLSSNTPTPGLRTVDFTATDGDGGTTGVHRVDVTVRNSNGSQHQPPIIGAFHGDSTISVEGETEAILDRGLEVTVTDADSNHFGGGRLTARIISGEQSNEDLLSFSTAREVSLSGQAAGSTVAVGTTLIGTLNSPLETGEPLSVQLNAQATPSTVQTLLRNLVYRNTNGDTPTEGLRTIEVTISDETNTNSSPVRCTIFIVPVNDRPQLTTSPINPDFREGEEPVELFRNSEVNTVEPSDSMIALTLTVSGETIAPGELLLIDGKAVPLTDGAGGTTTDHSLHFEVTSSSTESLITLQDFSLSPQHIEEILNGLSYHVPGELSSGGTREIEISSLTDSGGTENGGIDTTVFTFLSTVSLRSLGPTGDDNTPPDPDFFIAPEPDQLGGRILVDEMPQPGVLLYVLGLGLARSDAKGVFQLGGAEPDASYLAFPQRSGIIFPEEAYELRPNTVTEISGSTYELNPLGCFAEDITTDLVEIGEYVMQIRTLLKNLTDG
ncbi:hypothetical protein MRY87_00915, partial [bacterium]|nr:hypothetical protein [bacterium]